MRCARNPRKHAVGSSGEVLALPPNGEVGVPISRVWLPPQTRVDGGASAKDTTRHLVDIRARHAGGIGPDLVAQAWHIESGEVRALQPVRFHDTTPDAGRRWAFLDQQNAMPSLAQPIRERDAASP